MSPYNVYQFAIHKYKSEKEGVAIRQEEPSEEEEAKNAKYRTKNECLMGCKRAVVNVFKVRLKIEFEEDFYFAIGQAFDELEQIRGKVLDKQRSLFYKSMMRGAHFEPQEQHLADLREAREMANPHFGSMVPST